VSDAVAVFDGVSFAYGAAPVLSDVSFKVGAHEFVSIVGPNGGGKTTLLRLLLGLEDPQRGRVEVLGTTPRRARMDIGYMPQHLRFDPLFPITSIEVVLMGRIRRGRFWYSRDDRAAALAALERVGMAALAGQRFATLSGGQRQRVLIARALAVVPRLLLLDEPMAMVDPAAAEGLVQTLRGINRDCAIILVSHDLGFVSQFVDSVVCVNRSAVHHPTSSLTGDLVRDLYGGDVRMIRHDHCCSDHGHSHEGEGVRHA